MSNDLISRNELIKALRKRGNPLFPISMFEYGNIIERIIHEAPTACDLESVIAQLEEKIANTTDTVTGIATRMAFEKAIEILESAANSTNGGLNSESAGCVPDKVIGQLDGLQTKREKNIPRTITGGKIMDVINCLTSISVDDESFKTALNNATTVELITAAKIMDVSDGQDNKLRSQACRQELHRREQNREILYLFRGKRVDNGEWVEGFYFCMVHDDGRHIHHFIMPLGVDLSLGTPIEKIQVEVDPETIGQYTGLTDKNGGKIFEGDIVKHYYNKDEPSCFDIGIIFWDEEHCGFCRSSKKDDGFYRISNNYGLYYEVAGNIFDNPELVQD